ncbi:hypothetical protein DVS28_b0227 (plasmid) [Euzebya pacifica]|uniref:Uncharacterized protein n=1 Tax=Euzebya pacifica TaxID=1608957 RepID=A0A346Y6A0_9ACTN|nr:hypothetical protein [Euzebya pacifica]AXV09997.1 hypothetical protein DVS28_b0227 [Euzebya pacifica]
MTGPSPTTTGGPTTFADGDDFVTAAIDAGRVPAEADFAGVFRSLLPVLAADHGVQMLQKDRWGPGRADPAPHLPGDVPVLRSIVVNSLIAPVIAAQESGRLGPAPGLSVGMAARLATAEPYFVPASDGTAAAVLESDPPSAEDMSDIRLGHDHVTVWFGDDLRVPDDLAVWPDPPSVGDTTRWEATFGAGGRSMPHLLGERGCSITGVTISAGPDGTGISDWIDWIIAIPPQPGDPPPWDLDTIRGALPGRASHATLGGLVATCAAAVAWGDWTRPADDGHGPLPPAEEQQGKAWRKRVRKSQFRKALARGFGTVNVIDLTHARTAMTPADPATKPTGRKVSPHTRRGHWRRSRIGPRDGPTQYRRNWIAPTHVGGTVHSGRERVRVLPAPR